jgi:signal transduction histidine kinase
LAHGIYPPLLVDSGLTEALRAVANRSPLAVDLETEGIGRYGRDHEAAIYFCCLEALQNAGKHASDSRVTIRIWEESGVLLFEVADDGPGFDVASAKGGHGYVNMMDRLGAIGGAVRWESEIGKGTTIRGSVPLS